MSPTRHRANAIPGRPGLGFSPPAIVPNITRRVTRSEFARCNGPPSTETAFADRDLDALALCLLEGVGVRHSVVGALPAMDANHPKEELVARPEERSKELHVRSHVAHPYSKVSITSALSMHTFRMSGLHAVQLQLEPIEACLPEWDPSFYIWHIVGGVVDKASQEQKLDCMSTF